MQPIHQALIDNKLIDSSALVDALLTQQEQSPLTLRTLLDKQLITPVQTLDILQLQQEQSLSLKQACESLAIWNDQLEAAIKSRCEQSKPLCEILTEKGYMDSSDLMTRIEAVLSTIKDTAFELKSVDQIDHLKDEASEASTTAECHYDFDPEFWSVDKISESAVLDYLDLFNQEKKEGLENEILGLNDVNGDAEEMERILDSTFRDYHSIKGASRTVSAPVTERLVHSLEDIISFFKTYWKQLGEQEVSDLVSINLSVLDAIWDLRCALEEYQTEAPIWSDSDARQGYIGILSMIKKMQDRLESKNLNIDLDEMEDLF